MVVPPRAPDLVVSFFSSSASLSTRTKPAHSDSVHTRLLLSFAISTPPPPDTSSLQLPGTPMHTCSVTTSGDSAKCETRSMVLSRLANEMGPFFIGPMTTQDFLDCFLPHPPAGSPVPSFMQGMFREFIQSLSRPEVKWYDVFVSTNPCRPPSCS